MGERKDCHLNDKNDCYLPLESVYVKSDLQMYKNIQLVIAFILSASIEISQYV